MRLCIQFASSFLHIWFQIILASILVWLLFFFFFFLFMTADCISCVWVHLAFSFLCKKPTWVRAPFEDLLHWSMICFSLLMSRLGGKNQQGPFFSRLRGWMEGGGCCSELAERHPRLKSKQLRFSEIWWFLTQLLKAWEGFLLPPGGACGLYSIWTFILCLPDSFSLHRHLF